MFLYNHISEHFNVLEVLCIIGEYFLDYTYKKELSFSLSNENVFNSSNVNESLDGKPELKFALITIKKKKKSGILP